MKNIRNRSAKIIYALLLVFWMGFIYYMSSRTGYESKAASTGLTNLIADLAVRIRILNQEDMTYETISKIHNWIRQAAHFFEYMILGVLAFQFFKQYISKKILRIAAVSILFCIVYSISDEIHQYFVPGRATDILDVITDTAGSITGISIALLSAKFIIKIRSSKGSVNAIIES